MTTLARLFEEQAERTPEAVAVEFGAESLSYRELNGRANRLARHLRARGSGPEAVIGLCMERSLEAIVGILGILKSGAAYLPMDPALPRERLRFMVEDSGVRSLVTHGAAAGAGLLPGVDALFLDASWETIALEPADDLGSGAGPENLAYVMYTSGSTGKPKGVEIEHGSVANHALAAADRFGARLGERLLQFASFSFDASIQEIFSALSAGATLVLRSEEMLGSVAAFLSTCRDWRISVLDLPTSYWHELVRVASQDGLSLPEPLRLVVIGGERALPERFRQWRDLSRGRVGLINAYGPTEAAIAATFWESPAGAPELPARSVPIGRPIPNVRTHVLDRRLRPVPIGVVGDLYIGGAGVARGYRRRPDLTAEKFIPDPFRGGNERLYRTGDRARFLPSGDLEYLGRVDEQVKVRGFRVELGEIETTLRGVDGVREAVVRVSEDPPGETHLCAYVVGEPSRTPSVREIRRALAQTLPSHMVPSSLVFLNELPMTPSGKIDPSALPPPAPPGPNVGEEHAPPRTALEEALVDIWTRVLRVGRVGIHDDFFEIGGHSLLAMQVSSRVREVFQVALPVRELFSAPTVAGLARLIADKQAARSVPAEAGPEPSFERSAPIGPRSGSGPAPLSFAQQRLWVLDSLDPGLSIYNIPHAFRIRGALDVESLSRALDTIRDRHEPLRSVFLEVQGEPVQAVTPGRAPSLQVTDLGGCAEGDRESEAVRIVEADARTPFDLSRGPVMRTKLLRLDEKDHVLLVTVHHIAFDGWSMRIFDEELAALYNAYRDGRESPLAPMRIQYADFAVWQRERLRGAELDEQLSYWRRQLEGAPALTELPADRARPAVRSFRGGEEAVTIPPVVADALRSLGQREGATFFMTLLAAFQVLLHRHSGQEDVVVGSPVAGRNRSEVEESIGFFVNTLVLRTDLSGDPTFRELLGRVRDVAIEAYAHQDLPFERLVEELNPERSLGHSPLFQVAVVLDNPVPPLPLAGASASPLRIEPDTAKFDLIAAFEETASGLLASFQYSSDLFEASTVRRILSRLGVLLQGISADPDRRLSALPLLTAGERHRVLVEWNDTAAPYPAESTIHALFEERVRASPEAEALRFAGGSVSYRVLNERANRLARHLRKKGVGPEVLVGVCVERSVEMVVALLAILKAGGAYAPLDPGYPRQRLAFLLEDTGARLVLTQERLQASLPEARYESVSIDADWPLIARESGDDLDLPGRADDLAYVMYTSGSTGSPKGVSIRHRSVVRLVRGAEYAAFGPDEVFLQFAPISFDASTFEIWGALLHGGRLALMPPGLPSLEELGEAVRRFEVSTLWLTAGLFHQMVETEISSLRGLKQLLAGGDALSPAHVAKALQELPDCRLVNGYGPTESTTFACCHAFDRNESLAPPIPIGRPIANTRVFILDRNRQPVPIGVAGELYIGGDGLARDYFRQPELTARKFVIAVLPGLDAPERLYATGDRARYRPDGVVEFLGRLDDQVKIRGFRVEPGEIESAVGEHPSVAACAVMAREDEPGDRRLVAYLVRRDGKTDPVSGMRDFLRNRLPEHMVPSAFMVLGSLPLTPQGKVDRRALPEPDREKPGGRASAAPSTPLERSLAGIWAAVLKLDAIGIHDNFFELGGHSLLATKVISRVRDALGAEVSLRTLFQSPTIAGFAAAMSGETRAAAEGPITPIARNLENIPASFAQQRLWFMDQMNPGSNAYNEAHVFRLRTRLDVAALERSLREILARHAVLRTTFASVQGLPMQVISAAAALDLPVIDLRHVAPSEREERAKRLASEEARKPFDLARGPLWRAMLLRLADEEYILVLTLHHIVTDGWSVGVLFRELSELYRAFAAGEASPLPPLPIQYADFAVWQQEAMQGKRLEERLAYWRKQLADLPAAELSPDRPRPAVQTFRGAQDSVSVPRATADALKALSRREGASLYMTFLAALQLLLSRHTGHDDIVVGSPMAERQRAETEKLIGFFVNTLVLRTDLSGDPTFAEILRRVRQAALDAFAQEVPFERLVEALQPRRDPSRTPLFQVFFNMPNFDASEVRLAGVEMERVEIGAHASLFDVTLYAGEAGGTFLFTASYNADLFDEKRIAELLRQWTLLLEQIAGAPDSSIGSYSLLTESARSALPDPALPIPEPETGVVADDFVSWANRTPAAPAVVEDGRTWTYGELELRSRAIAETLLGRGLSAGDVVGISGARSFGVIAAMLGVLRSGGVMLALDPALPHRRRSLMLSEARARRVLRVGAADEAPMDTGAAGSWETIALDGDGVVAAGERVEPLAGLPVVESREPAYIFFTSGTSGVPKGVLGSHRGLSHFLRWERETFEVGPGDRCSHLTGLSFDAVLRDIFLPLTSGASLHLPDGDEDIGSSRMISWLEREGITILHAVPSVAQSWLSGPREGARLPRLRLAFFGGEPLTDAFIGRWRSEFPEAGRIVNLYGPTETTLVKCFHVIPEALTPGIQPVGRALPETQALVWAGTRPCGLGELGEIVLRTPFRSMGYVNASAEQRERFVRNPFRTDDRDVVYRTGDRGHHRLDGTLAIHGRVDDQVKVRGVRIEPAEVTAVLAAHRSVSSCAVVPRLDARGEVALIAYVVARQRGLQAAAELRSHLSGRLPAAMVPAAFVFLEQLPRTPNGKLDRAALPAPDLSVEQDERHEPPRTPMEQSIAGIWRSILGVERIGMEDDFFGLGGHSLKATRVMSRISQEFDVDLRVRTLFENPTLAALASTVESALARGRDGLPTLPAPEGTAIDAKGKEDAPPAKAPPASTPSRRIAPRPNRGAPAPLSYAQQRLWLLDRLEPGLPAYNIPRAFRLRGLLDVDSLFRALATIQARHDVLRGAFAMTEGGPVRMVVSPAPSTPAVVDLSRVPEEGREKAVRHAVEEAARSRFDLARGPLLKASLFQLGAKDHVLLVNVHHVAFDGWSVPIFDRELGTLYAAYRAGRESTLAPLPVQYADFAVWQREWLSGTVLEKQLSYWKGKLRGAPPVLALPASRPRPAVQTYRGATEKAAIPRPVASALRSIGHREGATLFMTLLAAFQVLMQRQSGQDDVVVGSPVAGRTRSDIEGLIGFFVNTLVFRTDLSGDPTFRELLGRVREVAIEAYGHQDVPFERIVEELNPERALSQSPIFQVMMSLHNTGDVRLDLEGLTVALFPVESGTSKFDLAATFEDTGAEIIAWFQFDTDLFDAAAVRAMLSQLGLLLSAIAEDPDRRLSQLPILTESERHRILVEWNDTAAEYPGDSTIHGLFERQAERTPDAVAVRDGVHEIRFRDLNRRANRLAHFLRSRGVGPEVAVGVCMERTARTPEALMAVLKAGGAYVPLDPSYPAERLAFMLRDSDARVLLTQQSLAARFPAGQAEVVVLDSLPDLRDEPDTNPPGGARAESLAYVIYTSGSTGTPKGVEAIHRACVNRFAWMWTAYPFAPGEVCAQKTALSFVDSVWEIFGPLLQGIPLAVLSEEAARDPRLLVEELAKDRVTRIVLVPSLLRAVLDSGTDLARKLPRLRFWISSGEALPSDLATRFRRALPDAVLLNLYGSSEVCADVTFYDARREHADPVVPIGRPISNTQIYILDANRQPVPAGVAGEIYVGGHGLARGYRRRPELTAERFLPDPFRRAPGARLFRTGDRGRFLADGRIEYLGRTDQQVKLRGRRIELGEIEASLAEHPAIRQAAVAMREDQPGEARLVAYVVPDSKAGAGGPAEWRGFLARRLPEFMVPSAFVILDALPLTPSGKIDRTALPAPDALRPDLDTLFVAPRGPVESRIAAIWGEILGIERVGVHENFFDLGGHSLLAVRLVASLEKEFGRQVALATVFRAPTVAELAGMFRERRKSARRTPSLVSIQPKGTRPPFFCVAAATGIVHYRGLAVLLGPDQPFYGLQSQGLDGARAPYESVEEMAAHYVREIREAQPEGPYYLGGYSFGGKVAFEM
ncbi:MAG: amino acid adenylation domain-containing protein, partial [Acidobacteriota bacterium]